MRLLWLSDAAAYEAARSADPGAVDSALLSTAHAELAARWQREGRRWLNPWYAGNLDDQLTAAVEARRLVAALPGWPGWADSPVGSAIDLCRTAWLYLLRDALLAERLSARLLASGPTELVVGGDDVMAAMLRGAAAARGLATRQLPTAPAAPSTRPVARSDGWRRIALATAARLALGRPPARQRNARGGSGPILVVGGGPDYITQVPLVGTLRATGRSVLHVGLHPPRAGGQGVPELPAPDLVLPMSPLALTRGVAQVRAERWWRDRWPGLGADSAPALGVLAQPALAPFVHDLVTVDLPRAMSALSAARRLMAVVRPSAAVLSNAASPRERAVLRAARAAGVPTLQLAHSGFNDLDVNDVLADGLGVWGAVHRRQWLARGVPDAAIAVTGSPAVETAAASRAAAHAARDETRRALGIGPDDVAVLLMTARPPHLATFLDPIAHLADLAAVVRTVGASPGGRLVIRPHPRYDDRALYGQLAEEHGHVQVVTGGTLNHVLAASDIAVVLNIATTGGIDALLMGRPLVWIRSSSRYPDGWDVLAAGALTVDDAADIGPALGRLLASDSDRAHWARRGRDYVPELVVNAADGALAAIAEWAASNQTRRPDAASRDSRLTRPHP